MIMTMKKLNDFSIRSTYSKCCGFSLAWGRVHLGGLKVESLLTF